MDLLIDLFFDEFEFYSLFNIFSELGENYVVLESFEYWFKAYFLIKISLICVFKELKVKSYILSLL